MRLEINAWMVSHAELGGETAYERGQLMLDAESLTKYIVSGERNIIDVKVTLAQPGERLRIVNVIDVGQPMAAGDGSDLFPGFLAPPIAIADGVINRLEGLAVVTVAERDTVSPLFTPKQAIIDMSGVGADYSPFSKMQAIVLEPQVQPGLSDKEWDRALRLSGLKAASYLARRTTGQKPQTSRICELGPALDGLPKLVAIIQLGGEGPLHDNYVYGRSITGIFPTYLHPNEFYSGAVVGGNYTLFSYTRGRRGRDLAFDPDRAQTASRVGWPML